MSFYIAVQDAPLYEHMGMLNALKSEFHHEYIKRKCANKSNTLAFGILNSEITNI